MQGQRAESLGKGSQKPFVQAMWQCQAKRQTSIPSREVTHDDPSTQEAEAGGLCELKISRGHRSRQSQRREKKGGAVILAFGEVEEE